MIDFGKLHSSLDLWSNVSYFETLHSILDFFSGLFRFVDWKIVLQAKSFVFLKPIINYSSYIFYVIRKNH